MNNVEPYVAPYTTILMTDIWESAQEFIQDYTHVGIPTTISIENATTLFYLLYAKYGNNPIANYDITQFKYKMFSVIWQYGPTWEKKLSIQETLRGLQLNDLLDNGKIEELFNHEGTNQSTSSGTNENTRTLNTQEANTGTQSVAHTGTVGIVHDNDIQNSGDDTTINNHAFNPGTTPATDAYSPLNYINEQNAQKVTKGTKSVQDESSTTTYANTDTTTNDINKTDTGTIKDAGTASNTTSGGDKYADNRSRTALKGKLSAYEHLLSLLETDVTGKFISKFKHCFKQFIMPERSLWYVSEDEEE